MANINFYINLFNNREQALIVWLLLFFGFMILHGKFGYALLHLLKVFFNPKIQVVLALMLVYVSLVVLLLYKINLWGVYLIKDTLFWIFGTAFILMMNAVKESKEEHYFRKLILDNIKLILILEFVINLYTFSLWLELVLIPVILVIVAVNTMAETEKEYRHAKKLPEGILTIIGLTILAYSLIKTFTDFENFATADNLRAFLIPILLSITYIPFLYLFALAITYETLFTRLDIFIKDDKDLARFAKRKIMFLCHFNLKRLNRFSKEQAISFTTLRDREAVLNLVEAFKK